MKIPLLNIKKSDVAHYLDNVERTTTGVIKNHLERILDIILKENVYLQKEILDNNQEIELFLIERKKLHEELTNLRQIARHRQFKVVK